MENFPAYEKRKKQRATIVMENGQEIKIFDYLKNRFKIGEFSNFNSLFGVGVIYKINCDKILYVRIEENEEKTI